jgi:hypothetical protein
LHQDSSRTRKFVDGLNGVDPLDIFVEIAKAAGL